MERECRIVNDVSGSTTFGVEWQEGRVVREITMWNDCGTNDFGVYSGCLEEEGEEEIKEEMAEELLSHSERHKISVSDFFGKKKEISSHFEILTTIN